MEKADKVLQGEAFWNAVTTAMSIVVTQAK